MRFVRWAGEDLDLAVRLRRAGLRCGWPGPESSPLHLSHLERKGAQGPNRDLLRELLDGTRVEAVEGLRELAAAPHP